MKIGILYICTGKYDIFWKDFYLSCEKYFLTNHEKHYFVFSDSKNIFDSENNKNIHIFEQKNLGWPDNTLMRFHIFLSQKEKLEKMDYLFFFNADLEIKQEIGEEILSNENEGILVTQHPGYYNKLNNVYPYERNLKSTAYIKKGEGKVYIAGGFNGGKSENFIKMCQILSKNVDEDKKNNIVALWHDESHLNKYILSHNYKLLDSSYLYPELSQLVFDCKIIIRNKLKIKGFGLYYIFQGRNFNFKQKLYLVYKFLIFKFK